MINSRIIVNYYGSRLKYRITATNYSIDWRHVFLLYRWRCRFPGSGTETFICSLSVVTHTRTTSDSGRFTMHRRTIGRSKSSIRNCGIAVITNARSQRHRTWVTLYTWTWSVSYFRHLYVARIGNVVWM